MKSIINKKVLKYSIVTGDFNKIVLTNKDAHNTIRDADVIIIDEYINREIVEQLIRSNIMLYKVSLNGNYKERTEDLNQLIVDLARVHGHVVHIRGLNYRLFDQSFDSINYIQSLNIETSIMNLNVFWPQQLLN